MIKNLIIERVGLILIAAGTWIIVRPLSAWFVTNSPVQTPYIVGAVIVAIGLFMQKKLNN